MPQWKKIRIAVGFLVCIVLQAQGADKYTDENRPYEFGFNVEIDGSRQQHRHEKKDKDGIIMGEFGFVTADDVYHVTVYATDKEGRFKILSMKNIHLKSASKSAPAPALPARQGHSLPVATHPSSSPARPISTSQAISTSKPQITLKQTPLPSPARSCSSCSIPTSTTPKPPPVAPTDNYVPPNQQSYPDSGAALPNDVQGGFGNQPISPQTGLPNYSQQGPSGPAGPRTYSQQIPAVSSNRQPYPGQESNGPGDAPTYPQSGPGSASFYPPSGAGEAQTYPQGSGIPTGQQSYPQQNVPGSPGSSQMPNSPNNFIPSGYSPASGRDEQISPPQNILQPPISNTQQGGPQYSSGDHPPGQSSYSQDESPIRSPKQYTGQGQPFGSNLGPSGPQSFDSSSDRGHQGSVKPTLVTAQMQIVDKNTDIHALRPGEKQGLPDGLSENDMTQLLYTFNYTVGFHGHFEEGYTNGFKKGYYFVTGRNGIKTRIDYVADNTGFHPKISQEVLDLLSDDVPKPETEKDDKYGLKGYEFKWLYYPVESKNQ